MPARSLRPCASSTRCPEVVRPPVRYCPAHAKAAPARPRRQRAWTALEGHRGSARERGYTKAWERARLAHLAQHPLCAHCAPRLAPATVLDHIVPHKGNMSLFWTPANWQGLCATHHGQKSRRENGLTSCTHLLRVRVDHLGSVCALCGSTPSGGGVGSLGVGQGTPAGPASRAHGRVSSEIQTGRVA